jgi:hypothetical protein
VAAAGRRDAVTKFDPLGADRESSFTRAAAVSRAGMRERSVSASNDASAGVAANCTPRWPACPLRRSARSIVWDGAVNGTAMRTMYQTAQNLDSLDLMSSEFPSARQTARPTPGIMRRRIPPDGPCFPGKPCGLTPALRPGGGREKTFMSAAAPYGNIFVASRSPGPRQPGGLLSTAHRCPPAVRRTPRPAPIGNGHIYVAPVEMEITSVAAPGRVALPVRRSAPC